MQMTAGMNRSNCTQTSPYYWTVGALVLLALLLSGLNQSLLFDVDEGAFTEATREMLLSHDWGHTTLNGLDRFDKPIGVYWLQALSSTVFGINEFAFRLPSALAAWIASLALARFAWEQWGNRAAVVVAVVFVTSLGHWAMARTATADALLSLFFVLIFLDLWRALSRQHAQFGRRVALWIALGLLVKGPVALLLPICTLAIYGMVDPACRFRIQKMIFEPWSWLILLTVSVPWYLYAYWRHGQNFIQGFFLKHNVERFTGSMEGHSGNWSYFLIALPLLWLPWSTLFFRALFHVRTQCRDPLLKYCWIWFAFVFCFFSIASTKLPHYLLYAGPAVCLLIAHAALDASFCSWIWAWLMAILGLTFVLFAPAYLQQNPEVVADEFYKQLLMSSPDIDMKIWLVAFSLPICSGLLTKYIWRIWATASIEFPAAISFIAFAVFQSIVFSILVLPWWSYTLQAPVQQLALKFKDKPETIVQWGVHMPSFATYRQQEAPRRAPMPGEMALVRNVRPFEAGDWDVMEVLGPLAVVRSPVQPLVLNNANTKFE